MLRTKKQKISKEAANQQQQQKQDFFYYLKLGEGIASIPQLFSPSECEQYIRNADNQTFSESQVGDPSKKKNLKKSSVRNSDQVEFIDENLSKMVYSRCEKAIRQLVGCDDESTTSSKFNPVKIDSNWKLYRYKKGQHFDAHIDSGRTVDGLSSFITVLIYLNGDLEGGQTVFEEKETISVEPEEGKGLLFLHQLKHSAKEIIGDREKLVIKSAVLFEKNENYEKMLNEKFGDSNKQKPVVLNNIDSSSVLINIGEPKKSFELTVDSISKYPDSMLFTLINSPMTGDVLTNEKGLRVFEFPTQNPAIFNKFILPIYQQAKHLDIPMNADPTRQLEIDNEFKFWGLLSPYDGDSISRQTNYSNKLHPWKSTELLLVSKALESTLQKKKGEIDGKLAILKAIEGVRVKLEHDFSYDEKSKKSKKKKDKKGYGGVSRYQRNNEYSTIVSNIENKYEVIPLSNMYDSNFFLVDSDKEVYETCLALFGTDCVSLDHLKFVIESNHYDRMTTSTICDPDESKEKSIYSYDLECMIQELEDKGITKPEEIEKELDKCGTKMAGVEIMSKADKESTWEGEYNDEYYPSYSLFSMAAIFINVKLLKQKQQ